MKKKKLITKKEIKEYQKINHRNWAKRNKEHLNKYHKDWRKKNPEKQKKIIERYKVKLK